MAWCVLPTQLLEARRTELLFCLEKACKSYVQGTAADGSHQRDSGRAGAAVFGQYRFSCCTYPRGNGRQTRICMSASDMSGYCAAGKPKLLRCFKMDPQRTEL